MRMLLTVLIVTTALQFGVDPDYALCIAEAESNLNPTATGDFGNAKGLWQFWTPLWGETMAKLGWDYGPEYRTDPAISTIAAMYLMSEGFYGRWSTDCQCSELRQPKPEDFLGGKEHASEFVWRAFFGTTGTGLAPSGQSVRSGPSGGDG